MKRYAIINSLFFVCLYLLFACNKNTSSTGGSSNVLTLSKSTVKIGEPVIATTKGSGSGVTWSTPANGQVWPSSHADSATFVFTHAGSYQITAYIPNSNTSMGPLTEDSSNATVI